MAGGRKKSSKVGSHVSKVRESSVEKSPSSPKGNCDDGLVEVVVQAAEVSIPSMSVGANIENSPSPGGVAESSSPMANVPVSPLSRLSSSANDSGYVAESQEASGVNGVGTLIVEETLQRDWRGLFGLTATKPTLNYFPPEISNGEVIDSLPKEVAESGYEHWENCLVDQFYDDSLSYNQVKFMVDNRWRKFGKVEVLSNEDGLWIFKLGNEADCEEVLQKCWHVNGRPLFLKKWRPKLQRIQMKMDCIQVEVVHFVNKNSADILLETKVKKDKAPAIVKKRFCHWNFVSNYDKSNSGRIWILWKMNVLLIKHVDVSNQAVFCKLEGCGWIVIFLLSTLPMIVDKGSIHGALSALGNMWLGSSLGESLGTFMKF